MDTDAPLTPKDRETMVRSMIEGGLTKAAAAHKFNNGSNDFRAEGVDRDERNDRRASTRRGSPRMVAQCPPSTRASQAPVPRQSRI